MCVREIRVLDLRAAKTQDFPVVTTDLRGEWGADFEERNFRWEIEWGADFDDRNFRWELEWGADFDDQNFRWELEWGADFDDRNFRWEIELVAMDAEGEVVGLLEADGLADALVEDFSAALDVQISVCLNRLMPLGSMLGFPLS